MSEFKDWEAVTNEVKEVRDLLSKAYDKAEKITGMTEDARFRHDIPIEHFDAILAMRLQIVEALSACFEINFSILIEVMGEDEEESDE